MSLQQLIESRIPPLADSGGASQEACGDSVTPSVHSAALVLSEFADHMTGAMNIEHVASEFRKL